MFLTNFAKIIFLIMGLISNVYGEDSGVIIGSSIGGICLLIIVILDVIAIFELLTSSGRSMCSKLIWILLIVLFPIAGLILYICCARTRTVDEVL